MTFKELAVGDRFEFVNGPTDGQSLRMYSLQKNGKRTYLDEKGDERRCWFKHAEVYAQRAEEKGKG